MDDIEAAPIINSEFQETAFQKAFNAYAEDIGNTSYDVSLQHAGEKYLVGIKTFGIASGDQKVAQFKAKHDEWAKIIEEIKTNASGVDEKDEINNLNKELYMTLAKRIAKIRNARIDSSIRIVLIWWNGCYLILILNQCMKMRLINYMINKMAKGSCFVR